ncbi:MAG TPA: hypothetical protein VFS21_18575 [Roseiflexaceae bacterium]|nr:hypothetical protein [Roseiflexaceae bacterium]
MTRRRGDPIRPSPRRPEELNPLPGVTGEPVEKSYGSGNTGGLFVDPGDGTIGHAGQGDQAKRSRAVGADAAPVDTSPGEPTRAGTNIDRASELPNSPSSDVSGALGSGMGAGHVGGMSAGTGRGRGSDIGGSVGTSGRGPGDNLGIDAGGGAYSSGSPGDAATGGLTGDVGQQGPARRSSGTPIAGGVAVNPGRGSDLGTIGPTTRDDLGGGMSGGTTGGLRERDTGGGLSGDMHNDMGSGRAPDLDATAGAPEQRRVGTEDDDDDS